MAALHPYEYVYFNALTDTKTPGALGERYDMDYWFLAERQLLERLLALYPHDTLRVYPQTYTARILSSNDGKRIAFTPLHEADFYLHPRITRLSFSRRPLPDLPAFHDIQAYGSSIGHIVAPNSAAYRAAHRAAYSDVESNGTPLARSAFDIYAYDGALYYLNANCPPPMSNDNFQIFLRITPTDLADLPAAGRERGFENRDFDLNNHAAFFDGKCIHRQPLPDYPIERIATGVYMKGELIWRADINLAVRAAASVVYNGILAGDYGKPVAQSRFDLYVRDNILTYLKAPCAEGDADTRFFLHITPVDTADLPAVWREYGFENLDFHFADHGADIGGKCVATRDLPDYPIERIRTGQFVSGEGRLWEVEFPVSR